MQHTGEAMTIVQPLPSLTPVGDRLRRTFDDLSSEGVGGTSDGGCSRPALSTADVAARAILRKRMEALGLQVSVDDGGSMYGRMAGVDNSLAPVVIGSHLDTVEDGGRYDGILGVAVALEAFEVLREHGITTRRPIVLVNWTGEEGARFSPAMLGSGLALGILDADAARASRDADGTTFAEALSAAGFAGSPADRPGAIHAALELHIEQDVRLDRQEVAIGVVSGIAPMRWLEVRVTGSSGHAGGPGNADRRDAVAAAARMVLAARERALVEADCKTNTGRFVLDTSAPNVVPGGVTFVLDIRSSAQAALDGHTDALSQVLHTIADEEQVDLSLLEIHRVPATDFDPAIRELLLKSATRRGHSAVELRGGIGHDSVNLARVTRAAMIFTPTPDGVSHTPDETSPWDAVCAAADVFLDATVTLANE
ncbi:MAG: hydantoinase/carbamoylase family amidase [Georgenia sp.]